MFETFWRSLAVVSVCIGVLIAAIYGTTYFWAQYSKDTADVRGKTEKREQVESQGEYRVAKHDYFYHLCSDIKSKQQNIKLLRENGEKDAALANEIQLNEMVNEYNTAASNNYTEGQFKSDELPYQINAEKEVESCGKP